MDLDDGGVTTENEPSESRPTSVLVHLSGSRRGQSHPLSGNEIKIGTGPGMDLRLPLDTEPLPAPHHATLLCRGATYEVVAEGDNEVWVNGGQVKRFTLASGDVLEIGRDGAVLRYRVYDAGVAPYKTMTQVFSDCLDCARNSDRGPVGKAAMVLTDLPKQLATQTNRTFRLAAMIRRYKPDVIQSWMYHSDLIATIAWLLSGRARRSRLIWGIRCSDMETRSYGRSLGLVIRACALLSRLPDAVIANSEAGVRVHRRLGYRPRRFLVVDNGIDVRRFAPDAKARREVREQLGVPSSEVLLALVARVDPMKDHATFLKAFRRVRGAGALLVGRGTKSLPEVPGLYRLGQRGDVPRLLAACDIVVCSSAFGEGFSNAIAEGMAAGLAPIATEVGDARRIIGEAGLVVPPRDPEALAQAIRRLVENEAERRELGRRARRRIVERFSLERASRAFAQVHREAWSRSSRQQA